MKRVLIMVGILVCMLVGSVYAQTISLDSAIKGAVDEFSYGVKKDSKVAVLFMRASSSRMSEYLIEEITSAIVSQRLLTVVDRAQLDLIQQEMNFQLSGEVSDSSAQAIGKKLGAQSIVTGSFEPIGNYYRFRVRVIEVETAAIQATYSANVQNDQVVTVLMGGGTKASASAQGTAAFDYQDFTTGQRWGTWALNIIPGVGSFTIMHDTLGGTIQTIAGGVGWVCLFLGNGDDRLWALFTGTGLLIGNQIFNIIRVTTYRKPQPKTAFLVDPEAWNIALLPGKEGIESVHLSYTLHF